MSVTSLREKRSEQLAERLRLAEMTPLQRAQEAGYRLIAPARMGGGSDGIGLSDSGMRLLIDGYRGLDCPAAVYVAARDDSLMIIPASPTDPEYRTAYSVTRKARGVGGNGLRDRLIADGWPLGQHVGRIDDGVLIVPKPERVS
jgi:hypothetical protein